MTSVSLEAQIIPFIIFILIISFWSLNIIYAKTNESIGSKKEVKAFKGMLLSEADAALYEDKEKQHKSLKEFAEKLNELKNAKM